MNDANKKLTNCQEYGEEHSRHEAGEDLGPDSTGFHPWEAEHEPFGVGFSAVLAVLTVLADLRLGSSLLVLYVCRNKRG